MPISPVLWQKLLPKGLLSRGVAALLQVQLPWFKNFVIRQYVRHYAVDLSEAMYEHVEDYPSFNDFFTRPLKPKVRPLAEGEHLVLSPVDGRLGAFGSIHRGQLLQAKGIHYTAEALLGSVQDADLFASGGFATLYLSPRDYHRIHLPVDARLRHLRVIPGSLFSVSPKTEAHLPGLYTRNERVVLMFETTHGPLALVLVGAMIVSGIHTPWTGRVDPSRRTAYTEHPEIQPILRARGSEVGRFLVGSCVVMLTAEPLKWAPQLEVGTFLRYGEALAQWSVHQEASL